MADRLTEHRDRRQSSSVPKVVVIIRHGEKKLLPNGEEDPNETGLSGDGVKRSQALVDYFRLGGEVSQEMKRLVGLDLKGCLFDAVYAMKQARMDHKKHSDRPRLTISPFAKMEIESGFLKDEDFHRFGGREGIEDGNEATSFQKFEEGLLVKDINEKYAGKRVLICWEHRSVEAILKAWHYKGDFHWGGVYNRTLFVTFDEHGHANIATELKQNFGLPKDKDFPPLASKKPLSPKREGAVPH